MLTATFSLYTHTHKSVSIANETTKVQNPWHMCGLANSGTLIKCIAHTDPEVKCDLTDTNNDYSSPRYACALRVNHIQSEHNL